MEKGLYKRERNIDKCMNIAYIVLCHKNVKQINEMIDLLNDEKNAFFIHIDKKSSIEDKLKKADNIFILSPEKRIDILWGDISMIQATYNLLESVFQSKRKFDYVWLISGQDFPIKNKDAINQYLESNQGKNFIEIIGPQQVGYNRLKKRNELYYPQWMKKMNLFSKIIKFMYMILTGGLNRTIILKRKNNLNTEFYFGSQWWTLTYECAKEIFEMMADKKYINYYSSCLVPDESIIQTLFMKSSYRNAYQDKLTYVNWNGQINHPKTFTIDDYNELCNSKYFMARKFDEKVDNDIIEKLYKKLK